LARKILLADDSVTAQNMGRRILTDAGYEVVTVNNGSAALKRIAEQAPDLIVLDVYMPGYSGLEVCQRIKENRETARIPVLLTVGKLEPFKPEEARRVRADAYIVKPFEASELLTALTKLEDKIVPQPEPYKPGRFAKAIASVEGKGEGFGDSETGWKERLVIPPPVHKLHETASPEAPAVASSTLSDLSRPEDFKPADLKKEFERPMPAGLPADITPEEIAAITAAAAVVSGKVQPPAAETRTAAPAEMAVVPEAVAPVTAPAETLVVPEPVASAPAVAGEPAESAPATFASVTSDEVSPTEAAPAEVASEPAKAEEKIEIPAAAEVAAVESAAPEAVTAAAPETESQPSPAPEPVAEPVVAEATPVNHDAEVLAAVASLGAPTNGDGQSYASGSGHASEPPANIASAVAELAAIASLASGPRWIAEPMALGEDEATFLLEHEMEKAYAATAAAQSAHTVLAAAAAEVATASAVAELPPVQPTESVAPSAEESREVSTESKSEPAAEATPAHEPVQTEAVVAAPEPSPADTQADASAETAPAAQETAAYAAAAAAGSTTAEPNKTDAISQSAVSPEASASTDAVDRQSEVELAAAWANWHQVRDSILGSQTAIQIADAEAGYKQQEKSEPPAASPVHRESQQEGQPESKAAEAEPQASGQPAETAAEAPDVSSIVDNMLAELKPKLMEELTKKLAKEKKKK
jgi:CheY-like chemotaxis protein